MRCTEGIHKKCTQEEIHVQRISAVVAVSAELAHRNVGEGRVGKRRALLHHACKSMENVCVEWLVGMPGLFFKRSVVWCLCPGSACASALLHTHTH